MTPSPTERAEIAAALAEIACAAGEVLRAHHGGPCAHHLKEDGSPASVADLESEQLILAALAARWPGIPVIAEETCRAVRPAPLFFLVDPLDGTREFLARSPEYAVNIALVAGERPVAAALAAPGLGRVWFAGDTAREAPVVEGRPGADRAVRVRAAPAEGLTALVSGRHGDAATEACLAALPVAGRRGAGSALKFGLVACGEADLYVRCGPTMEWDTAAGDHIVAAAGGAVVTPDGGPIRYGGHGDGYRNGPFAALGDRGLGERIAERIALAAG
ncbi:MULTISPECIES: 3'(2'),5'-bisphosphate nucleotidase CysQ [Methylobacterium]|uniref:3'(2'),5'-bisphosphate nucleotidase CysQ n=2 Tax=Pseudomonadota TaxID=1224 RepID=A0ABQ4STU2_9HYPH|nr:MULTISPECIES: 3'(2'),5'-bisphosphate nucleotidase CysQ [Methylobacterium]PIU06833.1 MAG: 3'(2'),5'-bisphosphate nucleotidase CysQ [Methylobacterium sp. CG09_land_8_20_14_0_10_71_15]PIU13833.1 MAG: 3'(2'),5'-bisphosphate nucleotidase CysQ [Methylobacterium sp. CG08_land_8_20_14_0_20_71_15]GBU16160.1 3'(2'),5'-bisphosphate nucleotidase [Methylobacterium sp.]GJE05905.1 3'(2'),5'-bisphosphate nucleotidase CysQ [Methylobacterium jeotgali]